MPCDVTSVKIVYAKDVVTLKVKFFCLSVIICQIQINSYMINYCIFFIICLLKLFLVLSSSVLNVFLS